MFTFVSALHFYQQNENCNAELLLNLYHRCRVMLSAKLPLTDLNNMTCMEQDSFSSMKLIKIANIRNSLGTANHKVNTNLIYRDHISWYGCPSMQGCWELHESSCLMQAKHETRGVTVQHWPERLRSSNRTWQTNSTNTIEVKLSQKNRTSQKRTVQRVYTTIEHSLATLVCVCILFQQRQFTTACKRSFKSLSRYFERLFLRYHLCNTRCVNNSFKDASSKSFNPNQLYITYIILRNLN